MKVYNLHDSKCPADAVLIDRTTPWGNPFRIGRDGSRADVCDKFDFWVRTQPKLVARARRELRGKDLKCHCAPARCHGLTWLRIANEE